MVKVIEQALIQLLIFVTSLVFLVLFIPIGVLVFVYYFFLNLPKTIDNEIKS